MNHPADPTVERLRCPTCREPVAQPFYCPGCKTPYHPACLQGEGCLVAGCTGKAAGVEAGPVEPYSPLWTYVPWAWSGSIGLAILVVFAVPRPLGPPWPLFLAALPVWGAFVLTGAAHIHDLVVLPARRDRWGTLAFATGLTGLALALAPLAGMLGPRFWEFCLILGAADFVLLSIAGRAIDRDVRRARRGIECTVVAGIIGTLAAIAQPDRRHYRHSNTRACYAKQMTVVGALEMYNLDKGTKVTVLDGSVFQLLVSGGYLQSIPQDPGQGVGSSGNYHWTPGGNGILCERHGTIR